MQTLTFTPNAQTGKQEATFTTGDTNVLQLSIEPQQQNITLTIEARIGVTMPWTVIKTYASFPAQPPLLRIDIPADVEVRLTTNAVQINSAGVLIS